MDADHPNNGQTTKISREIHFEDPIPRLHLGFLDMLRLIPTPIKNSFLTLLYFVDKTCAHRATWKLMLVLTT